MDKKILEDLKNPSSDYRGAPFWAWNGKMEPEELRRQIRIMKEMGLGGFFMHSRVGLQTKYLSEEWFDCIKACIDEAEKLDMNAWLYDEDRWPSGSAGGIVTKNPEYRQQQIICEELEDISKLKINDTSVAVFAAEIKGTNARNPRRLSLDVKKEKIAKGEKILHFYIRVEEPTSWFNGSAYIDTLSHEAMREFIKVTHEKYKQEVGNKFGKSVPGIFTDEPYFQQRYRRVAPNKVESPWTGKLPEYLKGRFGYDILDYLPELVYTVNGERLSKVRWQFYECVTSLFCDAFARQIGEWCEKNNMLLTGHVLAEETVYTQAYRVGSCMRSYEHMQAPGMDQLTERWREYEGAKQVSSVARQFGRRWRLVETYGCTGWDFNFEGHKAVGDWQAVLGINLRCQHLSWYTMEGEAKRDYPASISYQSPWWKDYCKVEDYFSRINRMLSEGKEIRDLLVIHPLETVWALPSQPVGWIRGAKKEDSKLINLRNILFAENIDFDYGDEDIISRHGSVSGSGKNLKFKVGQAEYNTVLVPEVETMRSSTLKLLKKFREAGGNVVFVGKIAGYLDVEKSSEVKDFAETCTQVKTEQKAISNAVSPARRISITDSGKDLNTALYQLRETADSFFLFVVNTSHSDKDLFAAEIVDKPVCERLAAFEDVTIRGFANCLGTPLEVKLESGDIVQAEAHREKGEWSIKTSLPRIGSRMFIIPKKKTGGKYPKEKKLQEISAKKLDRKSWEISLSEDNVMVLDKAEFKIGGGKWKPEKEILKIDNLVRAHLGIEERGGNMNQPWAAEEPKNPKRVNVSLKYNFEVRNIPSGALYLGIEIPQSYKVKINGKDISTDMECGWWCDKSLKKIPFSPFILKQGINEIILECDYPETHPGLEIVYVLGNFGMKLKDGLVPVMVDAPEQLKCGDWTTQGLAFYSADVLYKTKISVKKSKGERVYLRVPQFKGTTLRVTIDGADAGVIAWPPYELDITDYLSGTSCDLGIEISGSRRNSHGPLHYFKKWPEYTAPPVFKTEKKEWSDKYQLVPCGLTSSPEIVIKK